MIARLTVSPPLLCLGLVLAACGDAGDAGTTTDASSTGAATEPGATVDPTPASTPTEPTSEPPTSTDGSASATDSSTAGLTSGPTTDDPSTGTTTGVPPQTTGSSSGESTAGSTDASAGESTDGTTGDQVCVPNQATCDGEVSKICNEDGTAEKEVFCDGVQGVTCDPNSGQCVGACSPKALGTSYIGCDYYPTITANIVTDNFNYSVVVANTTDLAAKIEIDKDNMLVKNDMVGPQSVKVIQLPWDYSLKGSDQPDSSIKVDGGAYRLRSDQPVTVYQYSPIEYELDFDNSFTNDASLLLPVNVWSGDYVVVARNTWDALFEYGVIVPGFYTVTASEDDTVVDLQPSQTGNKVLAGGGVQANGTGQIMLDRGDVLQVYSAAIQGNPSTADVTGTRVKANKPIQVIGGHPCTFVPWDIGYCDHLEESMFPYETLAKKYIVTPPLIPTGGNVPKAQMVRIVATEDDTNLSYDPPQPAPANIAKAGAYIEIAQTLADFEVSSDKKIIIAQTMLGQDAGGDSGDPAMALTVATEQFRKTYLFHAPINYETNYLNIIAPMDAKVTLDGAAVAGFKAIGATTFGVVRLKLANNVDGNHDVKSDKPVGISVYGYGQYTSYWYPGGLDLEPLPQ